SWAEILTALNEPHGGSAVWKNDEPTRNKIRKLNEEYRGPILFPTGKGKQPSVDRQALLDWWGGLQEEVDGRRVEEERDARDAKLTAGESHNYGRTGTAAPGVGGHIRARRKAE